MPVYQVFQGTAFSPEEVKAMGTAFDNIVRELAIDDREATVADVVATKIVGYARLGEFNPIRLRDLVLASVSRLKMDEAERCGGQRKSMFGTEDTGQPRAQPASRLIETP